MNTPDPTFKSPSPELGAELAQKAVDKTGQAISATKKAVNDTADTVSEGLDHFQETSQSAINYAASQTDELARKGIEQARRASTAIRETAQVTSDRTMAYIRDEPVKAMLFAAAAGALVAIALGRRHP